MCPTSSSLVGVSRVRSPVDSIVNGSLCSNAAALPAGESPPGLSKEIANALSHVPGFEMDPFSLDDPLRMDPLSLDMLEGDLMLADPSVEDSFRSDRFK